MDSIIDRFEGMYLSDDLRSYDPYDIWKTTVGLRIKMTFNSSRLAGAVPALILSLGDSFFNETLRNIYVKQEFPIVRALACQILLNRYAKSGDDSLLKAAENHLAWLYANVSKGYAGTCWGLGFKWPAAENVIYSANTPHTTHSPYALEAFHLHKQIVRHSEYEDFVRRSFEFYEKDVQIMYEDETMMATSYGPMKDRIATNAVSYVMYAYSILLSYLPEKQDHIKTKIVKLYKFIENKQLENGSWYYIPDNKDSFIDCFHSCFILKNILKSQKVIDLPGADVIVKKGYEFLCNNFYEEKWGLYKRFAKANKLSLVKFDLYDNAEMLRLTYMLRDKGRQTSLDLAIKRHFIDDIDIYSTIDWLGMKRNRNTLRWAVMPYLHTLSMLENP